MRTKQEQYALLQKAVGAHVRLVNAADVLGDGSRVTIHIHGRLTYTDDDATFSVVTDDRNGHGTNSVSFKSHHLDFAADAGEAVYQQPSGIIEITIK